MQSAGSQVQPVAIDPATVGLSAAALADVLARYEAVAAANGLPGGVLLVTRGSQCAFLRAFGDRDTAGTPMTPDTLFRAASMTKIVTSVAGESARPPVLLGLC